MIVPLITRISYSPMNVAVSFSERAILRQLSSSSMTLSARGTKVESVIGCNFGSDGSAITSSSSTDIGLGEVRALWCPSYGSSATSIAVTSARSSSGGVPVLGGGDGADGADCADCLASFAAAKALN